MYKFQRSSTPIKRLLHGHIQRPKGQNHYYLAQHEVAQQDLQARPRRTDTMKLSPRGPRPSDRTFARNPQPSVEAKALHLRVQRNPHGASFHRTSARESSWYLHTITIRGLPQLYKRTTRPHHSTHTTSKSSSMLSHVIRALSISGDRLIELVLCSRVALVSWDIVCISFSLVRLCSSSMEYLSLLYIMHKLYKHPMCRLNMSKKHRSKKNWW
jgi:hypothetical protein